MNNAITYQNKDVVSKIFAENFREKSLKVYGLDVPKIKMVLPTNLPEVEANELRIDNLFLLEDDTIAILDYESRYRKKSKIKYLNYVVRVLERYKKAGTLDVKLRMIVIYTADIEPNDVDSSYSAGAVRLDIEPAFLSMIDSEAVYERLKERVESGAELTDEEVMQFIILPLTYKGREAQKQALKTTIELAKNVKSGDQTMFILAGILVFSDKIIDKKTAIEVKEWMKMTKVAKLYEEERKRAVAEKDAVIAEKDSALAEKDAVIAEKDKALSEAMAELERLKAVSQQ